MGPKGHASHFVPIAKPVGTGYMQQLTEEVICGLMAPNQPQVNCPGSFYGLSPHLRDTTRVAGKATNLAAAWNHSRQSSLEKSFKSPDFEDCGITPIPVTYGSNGKGLGNYWGSPVLLHDSANSGDLLPPQETWTMVWMWCRSCMRHFVRILFFTKVHHIPGICTLYKRLPLKLVGVQLLGG